MEQLTTTPFGRRPVTAGLMKRARAAQAAASVAQIDKWAVFRDLCTARQAYGVTDRDLTVLNALLSYHKGATLSDTENLVVFPSNRSLSERAHGMAESTLRRHLAALTAAGLILRHDSPNGKRYAARNPSGNITRAFGFDLRPLLVHARAIARNAAEATAATERLRRLREEVSLMKRDALKLCTYAAEAGLPGDWSTAEARLLEVHKAMRRRLVEAEVQALHRGTRALLNRIHALIETAETDGSDVQNERHHHSSKTDLKESERSPENPPRTTNGALPRMPLALVLKACPDILPYGDGEIRHWHQLVASAATVRGMMGVPPDVWAEATREMGPETAAITLAAMLQRVHRIASPGAYLRRLTRKAQDGAFSPGPMVMALLNKADAPQLTAVNSPQTRPEIRSPAGPSGRCSNPAGLSIGCAHGQQ